MTYHPEHHYVVNQTAYLWNEEIPQVLHKQCENHLPLASVNCGLDTDVIYQYRSLPDRFTAYINYGVLKTQYYLKKELFGSMVCP